MKQLGGYWRYRAVGLTRNGDSYFTIDAHVDWAARKSGTIDDHAEGSWSTTAGAVIGADKLIYTYTTYDDKTGCSVDGYTSLIVIRDAQGDIVGMSGQFQRVGIDSKIWGTVDFQRDSFDMQKIAAQAKQEMAAYRAR